jgi:phage host-nuclease inhibitor protein Gam
VSKTTRTKPQAVVIADLEQARAALAEVANLARRLDTIDMAMNAAIDAAKEGAAAEGKPLAERRKDLETALATFGTMRKAELFKDRKSLDLGFGIIGFRLASSVKTMPKVTWGMVLDALKRFNFTDAIRIKEEPNKEVLKDWPEERLATVGARREVADVFFVEINREEMADKAA